MCAWKVLRRWSRLAVTGLLGGLWTAAMMGGCGGEPVREDRTIHSSEQGGDVSFQHGQEGVFVADDEGGELARIFEPAPDVLATSSPLWSPTGRRLIFTTARPMVPATAGPAAPEQHDTDAANDQPSGAPDDSAAVQPGGDVAGTEDAEVQTAQAARQSAGAWDETPAGRIFEKWMPVYYECWLWERADRLDETGQPPEPRRLFAASCGHTGYVAANLAVRWDASGERILFIDGAARAARSDPAQVEHQPPLRYAIYEFELATQSVRQVCPVEAAALVFDWSPSHEHLAVVADGPEGLAETTGVWVGRPGREDWWHVPGSELLNAAALGSTLERLRATLPAWTRSGDRFASAVVAPRAAPDQKPASELRLCNPAARQVETVYTAPEPLADLHWSPDGARLGFVEGIDSPKLRLWRRDRGVVATGETRVVRQFAGWNRAGRSAAYVVPQKAANQAEPWALLLHEDPYARDAVCVGPLDQGAPREVFSGMRVTFPAWSVKENKLTVWFTFVPTHQFWLGWGLRPGDPAAILDVDTGDIRWMAISPDEEIQVGHYYARQHQYEEALRWYARGRAKEVPPTAQDPDQIVSDLLRPRDPTLFEYHCLLKLGRGAEAQEKLAAFRARYRELGARFAPAQGKDPAQLPAPESDSAARELLGADGLFLALMEHFYLAEVLLSLDAPADAEAYFRAALDEADREDVWRQAAAIALSQVLLIEGEHQEYAELVTSRLLPQLDRLWEPKSVDAAANPESQLQWREMLGALAVAPLCSPEFLKTLSREQVAGLMPRLDQAAAAVKTPSALLLVDLNRAAAAELLGDKATADAARQRIENNPARSRILPSGGVDELIRQGRQQPMAGL